MARRIVHSADWHLGYRSYGRTDGRGRNRREIDVSRCVEGSVSVMLDQNPDLLVVAGDVFHSPRPTPEVLRDALRIFGRIHKAGVPTIVVAGNHDLSRAGGGSPLELIEEIYGPTIMVAMHAVKQYGDVTAIPEHIPPLAVPGNGGLCVAHGSVIGIPIPEPHAWPVEAFTGYERTFLGHYHVATAVTDRISYSGSLEYVSSDIWSEARAGVPKGFDVYEDGVVQRVPVRPRDVVDLPIIDCEIMEREEVERAIEAQLERVPREFIARLNVVNVRPDAWRAVNPKRIQHHKHRIFHLHVRVEKQETVRLPRMTNRSLAEMLADRIMQNVQDPEDRKAVIALSNKYMAEAEQQSSYRLAEIVQ